VSETAIKVEHLKYRYPHTEKLVLDDINFSVKKGEFIGIAGENGAGKSTLCQALIGLVPQFYKGAYGGTVSVDGKNAKDTPVSELCRNVGLVFQNPFNQLSGAKDTVMGEICFGLQNLGIPSDEMEKRASEVMTLLDIEAYRDRNPFDLSGGQIQRVALASILVMKPDIILLDEPTSQLDPQGSEEVFKAVDVLTKTGITIVMVEQKINKLADYCDRILLLHQGKMIDIDTPERIFSREDLSDYGVEPPTITRVCRELNIQKEPGIYPATLSDALKLREQFPMDKILTKKGSLYASLDVDPEKETDVFSIKNLGFSYTENVPVIENLNLTLTRTPTAIIGQNGAGKTTLVKLLKGLLKPVNGSIFFGKEDISQKTVAMMASSVGYVFQNPDDQIFKYTVIDEVLFGPKNIGMSETEAKKRAADALAMVGLSDKANENPYDLELSERKMVTIASVIAMNTDVIILDEPTIAQDAAGRKTLSDIIRTLSDDGKFVLAILHDMEFVAETFSRIIVMAKGKVLNDGTVREVFSDEESLKSARLEQPYEWQLYEKITK
jgi:energy-coupling factor transport system ATP-binding protein